MKRINPIKFKLFLWQVPNIGNYKLLPDNALIPPRIIKSNIIRSIVDRNEKNRIK